MVSGQHVAVRTDQGKAPLCAWHGLIADETVLAVDLHGQTSLVACSHLMSQGDDVALVTRVGTSEDGLIEQLALVGVNHVAPFTIEHDEIGIGVGLLFRNDISES